MTVASELEVVVADRFGDDRRRGEVVGSVGPSGARRDGADPDRVLGIDGGALRVVSLVRPGWGRTALSYELGTDDDPPSRDRPVVLAGWLLNGHNTAQAEPLGEGLRRRMATWARGNGETSWPRHVLDWARRGRRRWALRRFRHWAAIAIADRRGRLLLLDDNLSFGLLPGVTSADPLAEGDGFVVHAAGATNGELRAATPAGPMRLVPDVANVPLHLLVVRDDAEVVLCVAGATDLVGAPALPRARQVAVVPAASRTPTHAVLQQAVSGQIGFAADTRVHEVVVARGRPFAEEPVLVDEVVGEGAAAFAARWSPADEVGLVRLTAAGTPTGRLSFDDGAVAWTVSLEPDVVGFRVERADGAGGAWSATIRRGSAGLDVQVGDDGRRVGCHVGSELVGGDWWGRVSGDARPSPTGAPTLRFDGHGGPVRAVIRRRHVALRPELVPSPIGAPEAVGDVLIDERFEPGGDSSERELSGAGTGTPWRRAGGEGRIVVGRAGARVDATAERPLPGRLLYTVANPASGPVELEIEVVPPGSGRDQGERGRAGVAFVDRHGDALLVSTWLDDHYAGASLSSFVRLGGYEDLYDAIWTNVGERITWRRPYRLRVAFDGMTWVVRLDDEPVLQRTLRDVHPDQRPLEIERVGIVANWEWGTDTGSTFRRFVARAAATTPAPGTEPQRGERTHDPDR